MERERRGFTMSWKVLMAVGIGVVFSFGGAHWSEAENVFHSGNVGIGTTSPSAKLHISDNTAGGVKIRLEDTGTNGSGWNIWDIENGLFGEGWLTFRSRSSVAMGIKAGIGAGYAGVAIGEGYAGLKTPPEKGLIVEGNVGIGTATPVVGKLNIETKNTNLYSAGNVEKYGSSIHIRNFLAKDPLTYPDGGNNRYSAITFAQGHKGIRGNVNAAIAVEHIDPRHNIADLTFITFKEGRGLEEVMRVKSTGNVGIGTTNPGTYKLAVNGKIHAKEVVVNLNGWNDFVFDADYDLKSLSEVEAHIKSNRHLPDIPSAAEVIANGVSIGAMQSKMMQKIEELTLYVIGLNKEVQGLKSENEILKNRTFE